MRRLILFTAAAGLLSGCVNKAEYEQLQTRVAELEAKIDALEKAPKTAAGPSAEDEQKAIEIYKAIDVLVGEAKFVEAKKKIEELMSKYGSTKAAQRAVRMKRELDVVGTSVTTPEMEEWYVGSASDLSLEDGATLVVFWEVWCPHCKREVPKLQETYTAYRGRMDVVGLTRITKSATPEKVKEFVAEKNITYPVAKEDGSVAQTFAVSGIPAAAIVKDGKIVWRGHPGKLDNELIDKLIEG